jgi:hypothetical protein
MKVVTYATHSYGKFDTLVNNKHKVKVEVIGWGDKWLGYMDKALKIYNYIYKLSDEEIVVVIDGFDSDILKPLTGLEEAFKKFNCKVILSKDPDNVGKFFNKRVFGTCTNQTTASAGMFMGEAGYLKLFLKDVLEEDSTDDQRNFNTLCSRYEWIKVDTENKIFYNVHNIKKNKIPDVYFVSWPGTPSLQRAIRGIDDYYRYFIREISLVLLIAVLILFIWRM